MIGTPSTGETTGRVAALLKSGGRSRALTMVRTELGRAYSLAPATPRDPPPRPSTAAASQLRFEKGARRRHRLGEVASPGCCLVLPRTLCGT